jgi:hypothetical protein
MYLYGVVDFLNVLKNAVCSPSLNTMYLHGIEHASPLIECGRSTIELWNRYIIWVTRACIHGYLPYSLNTSSHNTARRPPPPPRCYDPSIRRHSAWGAADEAVLNIVRKKIFKKSPPKKYPKKIFLKRWPPHPSYTQQHATTHNNTQQHYTTGFGYIKLPMYQLFLWHLYIMVLRGATSLRGALKGVGPENRDFFGPWNGMSEIAQYFRKMDLCWVVPASAFLTLCGIILQ